MFLLLTLSNRFIHFRNCHPEEFCKKDLTLSWRRPLSYRNQSTDLLCKSLLFPNKFNTFRSSHWRCSIKKVVPKNFAKFTWKQLQSGLQLYQKRTLTQVFSCEFRKIFKNTCFTEHLWVAASAHCSWRLAPQASITICSWNQFNCSQRQRTQNLIFLLEVGIPLRNTWIVFNF